MWRSRTKRKAGESLAFAGVVIGPAIDWPALFGLLQAVSAMQMRTAQSPHIPKKFRAKPNT